MKEVNWWRAGFDYNLAKRQIATLFKLASKTLVKIDDRCEK